mmetsp:Transcript_24989/g.34766  ORF Transcript_24989/g.34766 Transcript_24989/m.34766 type:complete len:360 (-) Transcript_24989:595-1674(-)|eukprot:CAMPEP_0184500968 /NCGR_PEP_ID=MMETSP0113_2-20130426/46358_1 /TAXON_ID=91329 /ORGANISM="Norrisiella sphaerica, Strain BC52" /LENGTH=359 /DNA_ID=CAMNT_0026889565 /DNA_START=131 /DNA_END=1210 /DNA_ORIENTATION=-
MGSCASEEDHKEPGGVDAEDNPEEVKRIFKLLLVGAGESGKSTLCKQMEVVHGNGEGFTRANLRDITPVIRSNVVDYMHTLFLEAKKRHKDGKASGNFAVREELRGVFDEVQITDEDTYVLTEKLAKGISELWNDEAIQNVYAVRSEFQLDDSAAYFFERVEVIAKESYQPTVTDKIRARVRTVGISRVKFTVQDTGFEMIDAGGQKSERRKWKIEYPNCSAIVFVASLSGYDTVIREDGKTNRLVEALSIFQEIVDREDLRSKPIILFLNKKDIFEEKVKTKPITVCPACTAYEGELDDEKSSAQYISNLFKDKVRRDRELFVHTTIAIDPENVKKVFCNVKSFMLQAVLTQAGLLQL